MIEISNKSKEFIDFLSTYELKEIEDFCPQFTGRVILHLYPTHDTINDENDDTEGFVDALLFEVHVYWCDKKYKYVIRNRDQIEINVPQERVKIRFYKDESTMIIISGGCSLSIFQSMEVRTL